jgi:hypothetical protein
MLQKPTSENSSQSDLLASCYVSPPRENGKKNERKIRAIGIATNRMIEAMDEKIEAGTGEPWRESDLA